MNELEYRSRYKDQMIKCGLPEKDAEMCSKAVDMPDIDLDLDDPEFDADEELSCWG
ncbi:MAG: hypothetical protein M0R03_23495 [Novosphingobium sp.]|jgi:hypothetical protein|nr:hypothetical protein [Novosphingobium sp.]MDD5355022.1 hypothetical protein [Candidatus Omnitrophota bacterium]